MKFLNEDGNPMTTEEWRKRLEKKTRVIGSGTKEDPYRAPGTAP